MHAFVTTVAIALLRVRVAACAAIRITSQRHRRAKRADPDDAPARCRSIVICVAPGVFSRHWGMNTFESDLEGLSSAHAELAVSLLGVDGLSALLSWCLRQGVDAARMEILAQDEYSNDAILGWRDRWLVFGVT
jgi:hypothetical protein